MQHVDLVPTGMTSVSSYGRADHSSPPIRTRPPCVTDFVQHVARPADQRGSSGAQQRRVPDVTQRERPGDAEPDAGGEDKGAELDRGVAAEEPGARRDQRRERRAGRTPASWWRSR